MDFEPEPIEALKQRFPPAIETVIDYSQEDYIEKNLSRKHVFDCEDGLRLAITREKLNDGQIGIHLSASFNNFEQGNKWLEEGLGINEAVNRMLQAVIDRYGEISGEEATFRFVGFSSGKGVPHWVKLDD